MLRNLFDQLTRGKSRGSRNKSRRSERREAFRRDASRHLRLEPLEQRVLLTTYTNLTQIDIPATGTAGVANPYPSTMIVPLSGVVTDVDVTLDELTHTFPADIEVLLVSPTGTNTVLMADQGGLTPVTDIVLTLNDEAGSPLPNPLITGTFQPTSSGAVDGFPAPAPAGPYFTTLSEHDGIEQTGDWHLYVYDDIGDDSGDIGNGWSLDITIDPDVVIDGDGTSNDIVVEVNSGNPSWIDVTVDGNTQTYDSADVDSFTINGLGGDDTLTVDFGGGNPLPSPDGIIFNGGDDADELVLDGGDLPGVIYDATGPGEGDVTIVDGGTITFTGLEPVTVFSAIGTLTVNVTDGLGHEVDIQNDIVTTGGVPVPGRSEVIIDGGLESVNFTNPTTLLAVNTFAGEDEIDVFPPQGGAFLDIDPNWTANIEIDGGTALLIRSEQSKNISTTSARRMLRCARWTP